ncbi:hypothetical protein FHU37_001017 [Allostreptomyces psammosilenae]|uniref:A-factor biosynthesis hotdog domain-containing protein n=1 Tax=Allostreptomyces psammosilenae TaxID=1892865 RepID=A0A852ZTG5_9ACTN|nr:ScbA/BarX family gamma-butyrolactone biosynthesis protein [Allostreptomyces psammosilenae]NYI04074.1 hypothetical protein [Allostreptomyces psammosilenae]
MGSLRVSTSRVDVPALRAWRPVTRRPLTTTVPREYVHRAAVAEVLLTDWETDGPDRFTVTAQWPRGHALYTPIAGHQDPLLLAETIRQSGALLAHAEYGVPLGHQFLMHRLAYSALPEALAVRPAPSEITLRVSCHDVTRRGGQLSGMRYQATVSCGEEPIAAGEAEFSCVSPAVYRRLRGPRPYGTDTPLAHPVDPASVRRGCPRDVVLAATRSRHRWLLRVDTTHPLLFDHPVDHVPGMLLLEAARQAAQSVTGPTPVLPTALESTFARYAEHDAPCWIEATPQAPEPSGRIPVRVTGHQGDATVFTSTVTTWPLT